jgi:glycosyltransferase involved in cell wall biosynthesis
VYLAASLDDPCSNALLEALATGLPALYRQSGGHPELVGEGGIGFDEVEELPAALDRLAAELETRRAAIRVPSLSDVADRYLEVLRS